MLGMINPRLGMDRIVCIGKVGELALKQAEDDEE
jgi:hypothetical protein